MYYVGRSHEWRKHGTCASGIDCMSSEKGFFSTVLELHQTKMDFTAVLSGQGIYPSHVHTFQVHFGSAYMYIVYMYVHVGWSYMYTFTTQYALHCINHDKFSSLQTADFNNAFMNAMGVRPLLECSYSKVGNLVYCEGSPLLYSSLSVVCIHPFNELHVFACMC